VLFGTAGTVADGGKTTKGWRVLGVGSIPSVELGSGNYKSQSTTVPVNGAYILAEDQTGASTQFGSSRNYFDYNNGKNTIATTSENFVTAQGNFSTAEQGSLVSQQLTGVCNSSGGCTGSYGVQTSVNSYKLYPLGNADYLSYTSSYQSGKFFTASSSTVDGTKVSTTSPAVYWLRSPHYFTNDYAIYMIAASGDWNVTNYVSSSGGFRPAGVLNLESVLL
jgi:hypothetical protein